MSKDNKSGGFRKMAIGSAIMLGVGYIAGILTAPKSGKDTRKDIKDAAERTMLQAEKELKRLSSELDKIIAEAKVRANKLGAKAQSELTDLIEKAKDTKEKVREMLSAIHEGDAEDQDLKKAIQNANNALEHLREYLQK